jgi:phosphoglycolate phosphatase-like HAD superfamily hydrolase
LAIVLISSRLVFNSFLNASSRVLMGVSMSAITSFLRNKNTIKITTITNNTNITAQLAVKPKSCLFIGDDKNDMIAGKNAGIKTVAVAYGYGKVEQDWGYDFLVNTVKELEKWIL